jgi:colanic acid biosynthesis glycosyl transferase WcaI
MHILCQKTDVIDTVMPSKILGMFASAKPSLVTGNGQSEVATLFSKVNAGYFIDDNSVDAIVSAIIECSSNKQQANQMGKNAREYILAHFSKQAILEKFITKISSL